MAMAFDQEEDCESVASGSTRRLSTPASRAGTSRAGSRPASRPASRPVSPRRASRPPSPRKHSHQVSVTSAPAGVEEEAAALTAAASEPAAAARTPADEALAGAAAGRSQSAPATASVAAEPAEAAADAAAAAAQAATEAGAVDGAPTNADAAASMSVEVAMDAACAAVVDSGAAAAADGDECAASASEQAPAAADASPEAAEEGKLAEPEPAPVRPAEDSIRRQLSYAQAVAKPAADQPGAEAATKVDSAPQPDGELHPSDSCDSAQSAVAADGSSSTAAIAKAVPELVVVAEAGRRAGGSGDIDAAAAPSISAIIGTFEAADGRPASRPAVAAAAAVFEGSAVDGAEAQPAVEQGGAIANGDAGGSQAMSVAGDGSPASRAEDGEIFCCELCDVSTSSRAHLEVRGRPAPVSAAMPPYAFWLPRLHRCCLETWVCHICCPGMLAISPNRGPLRLTACTAFMHPRPASPDTAVTQPDRQFQTLQ